jgi:antitoxin (DNA-binding transcriptional repressor) of toxin-antitoxin stability system
MKCYSIHDAQKQLHELVKDVLNGKTIIILDDQNEAVQLIPVSNTKKPRKAGSARGQIWIADDFDAPLADFKPYTE